jgi:DNA topoisomerase-1
MAAKQWIERKKVGREFVYTREGKQISSKPELQYLRCLGIPPAWRQVKIACNKRSKVLAIGYDAAGRAQYIYHPSFRQKQDQAKFDRTLRFARALPRMRRITARHLTHPQLDQQKVLACIVRLMDEAYFRIGNSVYAREHGSYGLTTLRSKHTTIHKDTITFDFTGKSGQHHTKKITNKTLARIVKQLDELPGYEVFRYYNDAGQLITIQSSEVNSYIKELMGEEFSAKDFRTWGGTLLAVAELAQTPCAPTITERRKAVTNCVKKVSRALGNTPAITRGSYIDPRVITAYMDSTDLPRLRQRVAKNSQNSPLSTEEQCVLQLLEAAA